MARCVGLMAGWRHRGRLGKSWCSLACAAWCHGAPGGSAGCDGALRRPDSRWAPSKVAVQELVLFGVRCLMPLGTERQCWMRRLGTPA